MNERIKELSKQAWESISVQDALDDEAFEKFDQKFAELIVKECAGVAANQRDWVENMVVFSERDKFWNKARIVQSQRIVDKIKQHFGVK